MKIRGVLLGTLDEQIAGGDPRPIDPQRIQLTDHVRVSIGFESSRVVGQTMKVWRENGRIMFIADVDELKDFTAPTPGSKALAEKAAVAISTAELAYSLEMKGPTGYTVKGGKLLEVGLTDQNENKNQPPWEVID